MSANQGTDARTQGATEAREIAHDVYTADPQAAARRMLEDIDYSKAGGNREYAAAFLSGIDDKTLPALSLGYTAERFMKLAGQDGILTLQEVRQAQESHKNHPLEAKLLAQTARWIEQTGDVRQADVKAEILKFQAASQGDKQKASAAAEVLLGRKGSSDTLLERINNYNGYSDDHAIGPEDIKAYLKSGWAEIFMNPVDKASLAWLANNWNHPIVQGALDPKSPDGKYMTESSAARLKGSPESDARPRRPVDPDNTNGGRPEQDNRGRGRSDDHDRDGRPRRRKSEDPFEKAGLPKVELTDDNRPVDEKKGQVKHEKYWSDGRGNTRAIIGSPDNPDRITIGTIGFKPGTEEVQASYTGWVRYGNGYVLYDGANVLDTAAKVTFNPDTGEIKVVKHPES